MGRPSASVCPLGRRLTSINTGRLRPTAFTYPAEIDKSVLSSRSSCTLVNHADCVWRLAPTAVMLGFGSVKPGGSAARLVGNAGEPTAGVHRAGVPHP